MNNSTSVDDEIEAICRHDLSEVEVFSFGPSPFPILAVRVAFPVEQLLTTHRRRRIQQDENVEQLVQLGSSAVRAFEQHYIARICV